MTIENDTFRFASSFAADMPRLSPPTDGESEFAAFAAQFAHRAERLRETRGSEPFRNAVDVVTDAETRHTAEMWAGGLLLAGLAVAALFVWGLPTEPPNGSPAGTADTVTVNSAAPPIEARQAAATVAPPPVNVPPPSPEPSQAASTPAAASPTPAAPVASSPATLLGAVAPSAAAAPPVTTVDDLIAAKTQPTAAPAVASAKAPASTPLNWDEARELQNRLKVAGFDPGPIDGIVGPLTTGAARRYGVARTLANAEPARDMLVRLRSEPTQSTELPPR